MGWPLQFVIESLGPPAGEDQDAQVWGRHTRLSTVQGWFQETSHAWNAKFSIRCVRSAVVSWQEWIEHCQRSRRWRRGNVGETRRRIRRSSDGGRHYNRWNQTLQADCRQGSQEVHRICWSDRGRLPRFGKTLDAARNHQHQLSERHWEATSPKYQGKVVRSGLSRGQRCGQDR